MEIPDAPKESGTERDGFLSYAKEWHSLTVGLATGLFVALSGAYEIGLIVLGIALGVRAAPIPPLKQLKKEPWYAVGGILVGMGTGYLIKFGGFI